MQILYVLAIIALVLLIVGVIVGPKASLFWHKGTRTGKKSLLIYGASFIALIILGAFAGTPDRSSFNYEVLNADAYGATVFLGATGLTKDQLGAVADSLYAQSDQQLHKYGENYKVMFYYRRNFQDHACYAYKAWLYDGGYKEDWYISAN